MNSIKVETDRLAKGKLRNSCARINFVKKLLALLEYS